MLQLGLGPPLASRSVFLFTEGMNSIWWVELLQLCRPEHESVPHLGHPSQNCEDLHADLHPGIFGKSFSGNYYGSVGIGMQP